MCNDVILHASVEGLFLYLSPKCQSILGYTEEPLSVEQVMPSARSSA